MNAERPDAREPAGQRDGDDPVVTERPSSRQTRSAPPPGSEPQGRITLVAAIIAIVVIAVIVVLVLL